jgi:ABC-2 type transport system permease protein
MINRWIDGTLRHARLLLAFARNSLVRDMTFRGNFIVDCISSLAWLAMNLGFYLLIFFHVRSIGASTGWGRDEFYVFLATTWIVNAIVQAFLMPNAQEFSELIRTGGLDYALLKPIDTQFLISFRRVEWASLSNAVAGLCILAYALWRLSSRTDPPWEFSIGIGLLYGVYLLCGVALFYSLIVCLAATSIWLGRNQSLYDFWFYITNFSRYPMEIYQSGWGIPLWYIFTFVFPILVIINVPARLLAQPLSPRQGWEWGLAVFAFIATIVALILSRWVFQRALRSYSSASS